MSKKMSKKMSKAMSITIAKGFLSCCLLLSLGACAPPAPGPTGPVSPSGSPTVAPNSNSPLPGVSSVPGTQPSTQPSTVPNSGPTAVPSPTVSAGTGLPANLAGIRFGELNRFLNYQGQSTRFDVIAVDANGQVIQAVLPLQWRSSRPQDFRVDADGKLTALVGAGYSEIVASIPGTDYEIRTIINVSTPGGGGGGGGGGGAAPVIPVNAAPVIQSLQASQTSIVGAGSLVRLIAQATDAESTLSASSYSWTCSPMPACGSFNQPNGGTVYWSAPAQSGNYDLILTVTDGNQSSTQSVTVQVQVGNVQVIIN